MRGGDESGSFANSTVIDANGDSTANRCDNEREDTVKTGEIGLLAELRTGAVGHRITASAADFGKPAAEQPRGWRFEGHHLSLSATLIPGQETIVTPAFLGANPATVPQQHERAGLRVLAAEADLAFDLVNALAPEQQRAALIGSDSLGDIVSGPGRESRLQQPEGTALAALSDAHREQAVRLLAAYLDNMEQALAAAAWSKLRAAGLERVRFAWAGSLEPGRPHYYRLHGPTLLIEYDNTQNRANHAHSVWHDLEAGGDPLRAHYHQAPHGHGHG